MSDSSPRSSRRLPAGAFDFTGHMRALCVDFLARLPELGHIDLDRVLIGYRQTRKSVRHGLQASMTPLRFAGGSLFMVRRGRKWTVQRFYDASGREMLYILTFYLPRFLDHGFREKLTTVLHELWHIGPEFDGDLRRHPGRCYAHSPRQRAYDADMERLADRWLSLAPPEAIYGFLRLGFRELRERHGAIYGQKVPAPKLILATGAMD
jgi:hypothetical protein